jgi:hypothetical protein
MQAYVRHWLRLHEVMALYDGFIAKGQNQVFSCWNQLGWSPQFTANIPTKRQAGLRKMRFCHNGFY